MPTIAFSESRQSRLWGSPALSSAKRLSWKTTIETSLFPREFMKEFDNNRMKAKGQMGIGEQERCTTRLWNHGENQEKPMRRKKKIPPPPLWSLRRKRIWYEIWLL